MNTPAEDNKAHQLKIESEADLVTAESLNPADAGVIPAKEWMPDPDAERLVAGPRGLHDAVEALVADSGPEHRSADASGDALTAPGRHRHRRKSIYRDWLAR